MQRGALKMQAEARARANKHRRASPAPPPRRLAAQGRDDLGRPLLQRALRIQEAQLGPDHPDVQAIRDVLDEEA